MAGGGKAMVGAASDEWAVGSRFILQHPIPNSEDCSKAMPWIRKAADHGDDNAQEWLGEAFDSGRCVASNYTEAMQWFEKAASHGNAQAFFNIGQMYRNGHGVTRDEAEAKRWEGIGSGLLSCDGHRC